MEIARCGLFFAVVCAAAGISCRAAPTGQKPRELRFSGYDWVVKASDGLAGPGPNFFSDSRSNVWVDARGRLHLRITHRGGRWQCAEVISRRSFGYGTYRFCLDSAAGEIDPQAILGLFTWSDAPEYNHREIDCEISRWGDPSNKNAQFVIQPYTAPGNLVRFSLPARPAQSTHQFTWSPGSVSCESLKGIHAGSAPAGDLLFRHVFTQGIPQAGGENARMNLWLFGGKPPSSGRDVEVVIRSFEFVPSR